MNIAAGSTREFPQYPDAGASPTTESARPPPGRSPKLGVMDAGTPTGEVVAQLAAHGRRPRSRGRVWGHSKASIRNPASRCLDGAGIRRSLGIAIAEMLPHL